MPRAVIITCAVVISLFCASTTASAQGVRWRHDYAAARKEATETGRPLFLDFGTEACLCCKQLEANTLRNPNVAKLLNERFIPVKVDASKNSRLADASGVECYPTLIMATQDGKVLGRHSGYFDCAQMTAFLNKAPQAGPARPVAVSAIDDEARNWRRTKDQLEADLAAIYPKIAAGLER